ncbi:hypothetical protein HYN59_13555 [Flavobacterium album]|uniref:Uncharacterized protein n=2 Tax=Flavobacterium album TaxID=2175091 RepID=A0A2S1R0E0_9FLAO|nr:hypothetical protein HYN59_13555 [Flavobacterium album]
MALPGINSGGMSPVVQFDDDGDEPPTEDPPPPAPINSYSYLLLAVGVSFGYFVFRRASPKVLYPARPGKIFINKKDTSHE